MPDRATSSKRLGQLGEKLARKLLKKRGYKILVRNYTCPVGEVDLIALDGDTLVFIEVKTMKASSDIDPTEQVHSRKQAQVRRAARFYLSAKQADDMPARFDVVAVTIPEDGEPVVEHIDDAFE
jgi:putative endonuclease